MKHTARLAALAAALAASCAFASAAASARPTDRDRPELTPEQASEVLEAAEAALAPEPAAPPDRDATPALSQLAEALPALQGSERREAKAILARPTDGDGDLFGDGYTVPAGQIDSEPSAAGHFCVFWVKPSSGNADAPPGADVAPPNGIPDYVDEILVEAEFTYGVEVGSLDWRAPKADKEDDCTPDPAGHQVDIYLKDVGADGLFGYEAPDPDPGNDGRRRYGYLVIDNDYRALQFPGYADPLDPARVTLAHEFNHLLQEGYDAVQDLWMFEASAVWMEEKVFPALNDYLTFVGAFASAPGSPLTDARGARGLRIYGSAVWNHWLERSTGTPRVVRRAWEVSTRTQPPDFAVKAFDRAIADERGRGFSREFARFAAATAEWRAGAGGFPDASRYPDVKRKGVLKAGRRQRKRFKLDHSAYRLVRVKTARAKRIRLKVRAERRVRAALALVGRRGGKLDGKVKRKVRYLRKGGKGSVALRRPQRFDRITAVVVNADGRQRGFSRARGDWVYRHDNARLGARLKR